MQSPKETVARPVDVLLFYAEHAAALTAGLYFLATYIFERFQLACGFAFLHSCRTTKSGAALSDSYILFALPLIAISAARMLLFYRRRKMAKFNSTPDGSHEPSARAGLNLHTQERHIQNGGAR